MRKYAHIHDLKIDVLDELAEELNGSPLLIAYEFQHDIERLQKWHMERFKGPMPYLGKGTTAKQETAWVEAWNRGELPVLAAHPASAGHGLNMQGASACHLAWFSIPWDYELYDQFIRRIRRDGTHAVQIFNHLIVVKNTIDELKLAALRDKDFTQRSLMSALNKEILRDAENPGAGDTAQPSGDNTMKLSRPGAAQTTAAPQEHAQEQSRPVPKGWGASAANANGSVQPNTGADNGQRERIQEQINPESNKSAFTRGVTDQAEAIRAQDYSAGSQNTQESQQPEAPKVSRTRRAPSAEAAQAPANDDAVKQMVAGLAAEAGTKYLRLKAVEIAAQFKEHFETTADLYDTADEILAYINKAA